MPSLGVDLGGTKIMAVLVVDGRVIEKVKRPTPRVGTPADVLDAIASAIGKVDPDRRADAIGIGVPGPVRPGTGVVPVAGNLPGWDHDVDVAAGLRDRCDGRAVVVDNDVNVGTLAEVRVGAAVGADNVLGVFMGTGVGAALVLDGELRHGPRGMAGELGHAYVAFRDFADVELGRGELEDYAGRRMMEARARATHRDGAPTMLVELAGEGRMKSSTWEAALAADDPVAATILTEATEAMAAAIASAVALVDIELVVLGGGMAERLGESFRLDLEQRLASRALAGATAEIRSARLGSTGGAIGAALRMEEAA
ncbi:MAG: ROK family protein [Acidimicrobiales bacterium]